MPDVDEKFTISISNGVMNYTIGDWAEDAAATVTIDRAQLDSINLGETTMADSIDAGDVTVDGDQQTVDEFIGLLDSFEFWFDIVTP